MSRERVLNQRKYSNLINFISFRIYWTFIRLLKGRGDGISEWEFCSVLFLSDNAKTHDSRQDSNQIKIKEIIIILGINILFIAISLLFFNKVIIVN